ncbi:MAG: hypothetical protein HYX72_00300 [Acidobacteria bacterium]|nr:hypothetical protein [Acidobacteriota bacterium]
MKKVFSFPTFLGVLLVAGVFATISLGLKSVPAASSGASHVSIFEGDTWYHILAGEEILQTRRWPTTDSYSFTAQGGHSMAFEWLPQVAFAIADRLGGVRALAALLIVLAAALMVLIFAYALMRSGNASAAFIATVAMLPLASAFFTLRPQLVGYIFLVILLICLERFRQGHAGALWVLPPLFLAWVNTHGSFVLGLMVLAVFYVAGLSRELLRTFASAQETTVDKGTASAVPLLRHVNLATSTFSGASVVVTPWTPEQRKRLLTTVLLSVAALAITPYGTALAGFTFHVILNAPLGMTHIVEYRPLSAFSPLLGGFLLCLAVMLVALLTSSPVFRVDDVLLFVIAAGGAFIHMRLLLLFVIVFAPMLAILLDRWLPAGSPSAAPWLVNAGLMLLISAGMVTLFPSGEFLEGVIARGFPRGAVSYLRQHKIEGAMLNNDLWGAYLVRSLPSHRVFIDGRSQLFEERGVFSDYLKLMAVDRHTPALLRKYDLKACLIERNAPLATFLYNHPDWACAYEDDFSAIFVRSDEPQKISP